MDVRMTIQRQQNARAMLDMRTFRADLSARETERRTDHSCESEESCLARMLDVGIAD